ncbi:unnamed protein product [Durusdinium trenchii]|uniref:JmjC domain-containing protein n=2 Tax=Durusdinium trenchii TaxID=1381693 RepID=A0ABP0HPN4_9DINO
MANGRWAAVCGCEAFKNSSGHALSPLTDALQRLADVGRCWDLARKIPPELYAAAHVVFQAFQAEASQGKDPNIAATRCAPGAFTAMLVLLLLWEAHDAPDELVDTALDIILPIEQTIVAPAMTALGTAGVLDCNRFGNIQDGWWPGVLDLRWLRRLTSRLSRKRAAWQLLAETGQEPWHEREVAEQRFFAEAEFNLDRPSLCLCILHGEGAATLRETLEFCPGNCNGRIKLVEPMCFLPLELERSYKDGGLLEMARRRFVVFLKSLQEDVLDQAVHCWRQEVAKLYDLEPIVPVKDWPDPFIRKHQRHGNPGAAMAACASTCDQEYLLFLEDDFQLVTRPAELVQHRFKAAFHMLNETANEAMKIFGVRKPQSGDSTAANFWKEVYGNLRCEALCFSIVAALDFPQGAPVDWEDGPLPSTRAAWVLVDAKAGQIQLPWQLAECGIAGVAFALCVIFTLLCWRHGLPGQEVDLEAGLGDWDARCASQDLTSARQDPVNQVAWSVSKIQGWLKARARAASLARSAFGPVGHEDAAGLCKKSWATMFYNLSDFDLEDLLEEKSGQDATWCLAYPWVSSGIDDWIGGSEYVLQLCRPIGATQAIAKTCKERKPGKPFQVSAKRCGLWEMGKDVDLHVPSKEIPRVRYPEQLSRESFERDFAAKSEPVIIEGLVSDWPAFADPERNWRGCRWDEFMGNEVLDVGFDPLDGRMMHFGDDTGEANVLFNPGRLRMPAWAFLEVARLRQIILRLRREEGKVDLKKHADLHGRLSREVSVQNVPFLSVDADSPLHLFTPLTCHIRDLMPLSFYLSHDTYALPEELQKDLGPQAPKLIDGWASPNSSRIWATNGAPWRVPYPPWSDQTVPEPGEDTMIYSCFHCDRMENFHSILAGEKQVVLVPPGQHDVLNSTRFAAQKQWLLVPMPGPSKPGQYMGSTLYTSKQTECTSDQSAVHPFRSPEENRKVSRGQWPDHVDFPVRHGKLRKGDTLYIPAYHWHWVATSTPPSIGVEDEGALALSVNFWWWPIHNDKAMEQWSYQNECESFQNARIPISKPSPDRASHAVSFYQLTMKQRQEAAVPRPWPTDPVPSPHVAKPKHRDGYAKKAIKFELVD